MSKLVKRRWRSESYWAGTARIGSRVAQRSSRKRNARADGRPRYVVVIRTTTTTPARLSFSASAETITAGLLPDCFRPTGSPKSTSHTRFGEGSRGAVEQRSALGSALGLDLAPCIGIGAQGLIAAGELLEEHTPLERVGGLIHQLGTWISRAPAISMLGGH